MLLYIITNDQKQPKYSSIEKWLNKVWFNHIKYDGAAKKKGKKAFMY